MIVGCMVTEVTHYEVEILDEDVEMVEEDEVNKEEL